MPRFGVKMNKRQQKKYLKLKALGSLATKASRKLRLWVESNRRKLENLPELKLARGSLHHRLMRYDLDKRGHQSVFNAVQNFIADAKAGKIDYRKWVRIRRHLKKHFNVGKPDKPELPSLCSVEVELVLISKGMEELIDSNFSLRAWAFHRSNHQIRRFIKHHASSNPFFELGKPTLNEQMSAHNLTFSNTKSGSFKIHVFKGEVELDKELSRNEIFDEMVEMAYPGTKKENKEQFWTHDVFKLDTITEASEPLEQS